MISKEPEKKLVKVQISEVDYSLKSEDNPEYIRELAKFVDIKISTIANSTNVKSQMKIAVLTALNITDELFQLKKEYQKLVKKIEDYETLSRELCNNVDNNLNQYLEVTE